MAERRIAEQVKKMRADSGFAITIDVKTGEILALANSPTYDSSAPQKADAEDRGNRAVLAPVRAGQRAEDPDLGRADRLRRGEPRHQGADPAAAPVRRSLDQGPLQARDDQAQHARGDRELLQHRHRSAHPAAQQADAARLPGELRARLARPASRCRGSPPASCRGRHAGLPARPGGLRPGALGDRHPGGGGDRRHRQRRRLQPADAGQEDDRRRRDRCCPTRGRAAPGHLGAPARPRCAT